MHMEFSKFEKDGSKFSLSDIAFALEILANQEGVWNPTDDPEWNAMIMEAAKVLRVHQQQKESKRVG